MPAHQYLLDAAKTHCKMGHPFDEKNTYFRPDGGRACRACHVQWSTQYKRRHTKEVTSDVL